MTLTLTKRIGIVAAQSVIAASMLMPVAVFAQTPSASENASANGSAATPVANPANTNTTAGTADGNTFTALTQIPQINNIATADNFSTFINTLYKICIGVGAVLAVLMIMYAGVLFMTSSGSVQGNEKAKKYISNAIFGLVLILTPTIVFGIINPSILNINIGSEFNKLQTQLQQVVPGGNAAGTFTGADTYLWQDATNSSDDASRCAANGGTLQRVCGVNADGSGGSVIPGGSSCPTGQTMVSVCKAPTNSPTTGNSCTDQYSKIQTYDLGSNLRCQSPAVAAPHGCCAGSNPQNTLCCAIPKTATAATPNTTGPSSPSATQPAPQPSTQPATAATGYGWAIYMVPRGKTSPETLASKGPFATSQECSVSLTNFFKENNVDLSGNKAPLCNCSSKISQQPGCPVR